MICASLWDDLFVRHQLNSASGSQAFIRERQISRTEHPLHDWPTAIPWIHLEGCTGGWGRRIASRRGGTFAAPPTTFRLQRASDESVDWNESLVERLAMREDWPQPTST
ncbi:hypothetical protein O988_07546 [Pseudogymnoascus sp. VKM F-3808]|nr:hypothetical protein O988_07546 [Pseudogymnoascus sp. VKM F-3808]